MSRYIDGFVLPVAKKNLARYRRVARVAAKVWRDHGALEYVECVADQLTSKHEGKTFTSLFPKLAKVKKKYFTHQRSAENFLKYKTYRFMRFVRR